MNIKLFSFKDPLTVEGGLSILFSLTLVGGLIVGVKALGGEKCGANAPEFELFSPVMHSFRVAGCFVRGLTDPVPNPLGGGSRNVVNPPRR